MPATDLGRLHLTMERIRPVASLVLNDVAFAHGLKLRYPDMDVILRLMPQWGGTDDRLTGNQWAAHAAYYAGRVSDTRIIVHGRNEPQPPYSDDAVQFAVNFGRECLKNGLRAVLMNISVATLPMDQVWRLRPVIDLINANPGKLYLGMHAYTPLDWRKWQEWYLGNFLYINRYCEQQGIDAPDIIFTEFGYDTVADRPHGSGSWCVENAVAEMGQVGAARNLIEAWNATMGDLENVVAACYYTAGGTGSEWARFNALDERWLVYWDTLNNEWPVKRVVVDPPVEPPAPPPVKIPAPLPGWWVWLVRFLRERLGLDV